MAPCAMSVASAAGRLGARRVAHIVDRAVSTAGGLRGEHRRRLPARGERALRLRVVARAPRLQHADGDPAGLALLMLAAMGRRLARGGTVHRHAWAAAFAALGFILTLLGGVMTLTWPLSGPTAFDNIAFGEPSLALGVILLAGSYLLGADRFWRDAPDAGAPAELRRESWPRLATLLQPLSWFGAAMGLGLIAIAFVGPFFGPWEAPPQEPISGEFADYPWLENAFIALMYAGIGVGAVLLPFALAPRSIEKARGLLKTVGTLFALAGAIWVLFGAMNYYTHIGLTINTYEQQQQEAAPAQLQP